MRDAIIVGCGIVGATVARALRTQGLRDVMVLDANRVGAGTPPSGGHLKPGWFGGMPKNQYMPAMDLLKEVWGLYEEQFNLWPVGTSVTVYRVNTDQVVNEPRTIGNVTTLDALGSYPVVQFVDAQGSSQENRCRLLVVATGVWAGELLPDVLVTPKVGVSFRFPGRIEGGLIKPWAPYKQVVAHQQGPSEIWIGDGTAILRSNWTDERTRACQLRCVKALGRGTGPSSLPLRTLIGTRPYCDHPRKEPCLLRRLGKRAWLATGAGKSGTIAAGWAAWRICNEFSG